VVRGPGSTDNSGRKSFRAARTARDPHWTAGTARDPYRTGNPHPSYHAVVTTNPPDQGNDVCAILLTRDRVSM
jgi:hypothetical protein